MIACLFRDDFEKVTFAHRKALGHRASVCDFARYAITPSDAHNALTGHGQVLQHRPTRGYRLQILRCDAELLHTEHRSNMGAIFFVKTYFYVPTTEIWVPRDDVVDDVDDDEIDWGLG